MSRGIEEDRIVDGDPNQVTEITDIWTFSRDTKSRDPNWKLVETAVRIKAVAKAPVPV